MTIKFSDLNLAQFLLKALQDMQFETPSPVQEQTIPHLLNGKDVIAQAQTGTGKTAAFALPILQKINVNARHPQALVLAPTRELAIQVGEQFIALAAHEEAISVGILCGGQDYSRQLKKLREGAHIVVGTPGRILDHIERGTLRLDNLAIFVLDEADEMLRMGFIEDVETILAKLPAQKQMALFSATMPSRIRHIANNYLTNAVSVEIRSETATVKSVEQRFLFASPAQKPTALLRVLAVEEYQGVMVFVRTKSSTEEVAGALQQQGHKAMAIHGDITQNLRESIISQFREGAIDILVATDVAARGLDVERVTHVINYDVPQDNETYVHRIGRTGRAGRSGVTVLFITPKESRILNSIERHTRQGIEKINVPDDQMIQEAKLKRFMNNINKRLENRHLGDYQRLIEQFLKENPETNAISVAAALALLINKDKAWKGEASLPKPFRTPKESRPQEGYGRDRESSGRERSRDRKLSFEKAKPFKGDTFKSDRRIKANHAEELFRIDIGRIHGVKPGNIVGAIANEAGLESRFITGLKIHEDHSTVKLPQNMSKEIFKDLNKAWVCGRQLKLTSMGAA